MLTPDEVVKNMRAKRRFKIRVGHMTFEGSRPTGEEFGLLTMQRISDAEALRRYVDNWQGVRACDLFEGGSKEEVPFSKEVFDEAIGDLTEVWQPIIKEMGDSVSRQVKNRQENRKN